MLRKQETHRAMRLYDVARADVFSDGARAHVRRVRALIEAGNEKDDNDAWCGRTPSLMAIALLQLQALLIQLISELPHKHRGGFILSLLRPLVQAVRWILLSGLLVLDQVARIFSVEQEMTYFVSKQSQQRHGYHDSRRHHHHQQLNDTALHSPPIDSERLPYEIQDRIVHEFDTFPLIEEVEEIDEGDRRSDEKGTVRPVSVSESVTHASECSTSGPASRRGPLPRHERDRKSSLPSKTATAVLGHVRSLSNNMTMPSFHAEKLPLLNTIHPHRPSTPHHVNSSQSSSGHSLRRITGTRDLVHSPLSRRGSGSSNESLSQKYTTTTSTTALRPATADSAVHYHEHHHHHIHKRAGSDPSTTPRRGAAWRT
ncbi:hypothetical protein BCR43DRAFT_488465 [Syncephalastrum racemosum]|uniref:Uncharacterized protein n=1 Tax=Syncephalastrum racemosum TaxID=13706 RepID=A0A1X2HIS2_SYNRA|nr:hypothetical protein BCR43DRAFT_488465 [Syncephalastrum racemosum]